ncbi:MAG: M28 family peptidase [Clostridia bacterium]|nr:M28 family peptidase [Clostridia bacterium]
MDLKKLRDNSDAQADFMMQEITTVIKTCGKRLPGSDGEKAAVDYMANTLKEYCDDVKIEPFEVHPKAFFNWIRIMVTIMLAAMVSYFFIPLLAIILVGVAMLLMLLQFVLYLEIVDFLYPKSISHNLMAVKKPKGEVKRRILFNGHPDVAHEWTMSYHISGDAFVAHFVISMIGIMALVGASIASIVLQGGIKVGVAEGLPLILGCVCLVFVPFWILMYVMWNTRVIVDGANDNLTGCYMGIAVMKALHDEGIEFENTEVGVLITGSEEAGIRGARAWAKRHGASGDYKDVETLIYAYDTLREGKFLCVNKKDLNNTVNADKHASELFYNAAKSIDIQCSYGSVPLGATDSAAFNKGGYQAVGITALDHKLRNYYHTRYDTYDNMDKQCLSDCYKVTLKTLEDFDNEGAAEQSDATQE